MTNSAYNDVRGSAVYNITVGGNTVSLYSNEQFKDPVSGVQTSDEKVMAAMKNPFIVLLLIDTSGSMSEYGRIQQVREGLANWKKQMGNKQANADNMIIGVITFGNQVRLAVPFCPASRFKVPRIPADGGTYLGEGLRASLEAIDAMCQVVRQRWYGTPNRPVLIIVSDGYPSEREKAIDMIEPVQRRITGNLDPDLDGARPGRPTLSVTIGAVSMTDTEFLGKYVVDPELEIINVEEGNLGAFILNVSLMSAQLSSAEKNPNVMRTIQEAASAGSNSDEAWTNIEDDYNPWG